MVETPRLLVQTEHSVEEVGRKVGYGDPGYFVGSFGRPRRHPARLTPRRSPISQSFSGASRPARLTLTTGTWPRASEQCGDRLPSKPLWRML
jgi:AraC-like DNA-binding protein